MTNDSTMKLFGRTIFQKHNTDVPTHDSSSEFSPHLAHEDFSDHSLHSSLSSSSPLEENSSNEHDSKRYKEQSRKEPTSVLDYEEASKQTTEDLNIPTTSETETCLQNSTKIDEQSDMSQDKAPNKILPCPRCKSMDTKFCYYNNYNANQPRHFCKNCQRYWTSGGTTRSMLVGAGRRKNKISSLSSDASHNCQMSTVLTFGSYSPNMSSNSLAKKMNVGSDNETSDKSNQCFFPQQFPWNPAMCYPVSFQPNIAYYGGCLVPSWSVQPITTQSCVPSKPTLGKHSRDGLENNNKESDNNSVLIPKTLRIEDPIEASKGSNWLTLGIKNGGGLFNGFASMGGDRNHVVEADSSVLKANPAALSRSFVFREMI